MSNTISAKYNHQLEKLLNLMPTTQRAICAAVESGQNFVQNQPPVIRCRHISDRRRIAWFLVTVIFRRSSGTAIR